MLPIVDKPTIQFIVEEAIASGIEDILVVTGKGKRPIEDHFDSNFELESNLSSKGKKSCWHLLKKQQELIYISSVKTTFGIRPCRLASKSICGK